MAQQRTITVIGNFRVELGEKLLMIRDLKDNLLKAESVKPFEAEDKYKELCDRLREKIKERIAAGKRV